MSENRFVSGNLIILYCNYVDLDSKEQLPEHIMERIAVCTKIYERIMKSKPDRANTMIKIFGKDLYNDKSLMQHFNELIGYSEVKPFECVGTIDEINSICRKAAILALQELFSKNTQVDSKKTHNIEISQHHFNIALRESKKAILKFDNK